MSAWEETRLARLGSVLLQADFTSDIHYYRILLSEVLEGFIAFEGGLENKREDY
jgi:hypothetical protein